LNYLKLINQFWRWKKLYNFSHAETVLYFAILDCANNMHWQKPFHIPNTVLMKICDIDRKQLARCRARLIEKGLIQYTNGNRWNAGYYDICSVLPEYDISAGAQNGT